MERLQNQLHSMVPVAQQVIILESDIKSSTCALQYHIQFHLGALALFIPSYVSTLSNQKAKNGASCLVYIQNAQLVSYPKTNNQMRNLVQIYQL